MSTVSLPPPVEIPLALAEASSETRLGRWRAKVNARFGYALADQVVYSFGNMVVAAMLSRHCGQRQFGIYILTQRAMDVLIQLCNVFLWGPFSFNLPVTVPEARARYQGSVLQWQLLCCAAFTAALWFASRWAATLTHPDFHETFAPLVLSGGGILFREFTRRMYFAQMRMKEAFWTEVATVLLQVAGVEWLSTHHHLDVPHTLEVLCTGAVLVSLWWLLRDAVHLRFSLHSAWADLRLNLRLGRWFLGSNMVFMASSQCNPWVLGALLGGGSVGAYAICESVVNIPRVALTSMQNVMGPSIATAYAERGVAGVRGAVKRFDRMLFAGSMCFAACIVAMGPWVAHLIFKATPENARTLLTLLAVNLVAYACTLAQSYGLTALGRADTTFYANGLGLVVQAAICVCLVHWFGVPGAASAMVLGNVIVLIVRHRFYRRELVRA